jgi:hypothetical protein
MEVHLAFRGPKANVRPVSELKSAMIVSAIQALRSRDLYERYLEVLAPEVRAPITTLVAGGWVPIELGLEHYRAADRLGLEPRVIESIGSEVAERMNKSFLAVAVQLSKRVGVTPWNALSLAHRITDLNWRGSDVAVYKVGAKEALYEWAGQPCAAIPYFVTSFSAHLRALASLFSDKAHARPIPERSSAMTLCCRLSWV